MGAAALTVQKGVTFVALVAWGVQLVDALALDKVKESCLIGAFVDVESTCQATEVSFRLQVMLALGLVSSLFVQQTGNELGSCDLLLNGLMWAVQHWMFFFNHKLRTLLGQLVFNDGGRQALVDSLSTGTALIAAAMWLPPVKWCLPGLAALLDKLLLVLLRLVCMMSRCLLVQIVLLVSKHCCQSCGSMPIDLLMILVKDCLPFDGLVVLE